MITLSVSTRRKLVSVPIHVFSYYSIFISCSPVFSSLGSIPIRTTGTELQPYSNAYLLLETGADGSSLSLLFLQRKIKEILVSITFCIGFSHKFKRTRWERFWSKESMCFLSPWHFSCLAETLSKEAGQRRDNQVDVNNNLLGAILYTFAIKAISLLEKL